MRTTFSVKAGMQASITDTKMMRLLFQMTQVRNAKNTNVLSVFFIIKIHYDNLLTGNHDAKQIPEYDLQSEPMQGTSIFAIQHTATRT